MAAGKEINPTEYIGHHLTHGTHQLGDGGFWTIHFDSLGVSLLLGLIGIGFIWWVVRGATSGVPNRRSAIVGTCAAIRAKAAVGPSGGDPLSRGGVPVT